MDIKEELLYLDTRRKIYKAILKNPGIHQRELERITKITSGALRYHVSRLIKNNIIINRCERGYTRYFVTNNIDNNDKKILNLLRQKMPRKIILRLISDYWDLQTKKQIKTIGNPSVWNKEDVERYNIKLNLRTINYHLQKLIDAGVVERIRNGRKISYGLINIDKILDLLIRYQGTFDDYLVDDTLNFYKSKNYHKIFGKGIDNIVGGFKEVFPPPFYI